MSMSNETYGWRVLILAPGDTWPGSVAGTIPVSDAAADRLEPVLRREDAAAALDYILSEPEGGPSCGCGGNHWECDYGEDDDDADQD